MQQPSSKLSRDTLGRDPDMLRRLTPVLTFEHCGVQRSASGVFACHMQMRASPQPEQFNQGPWFSALLFRAKIWAWDSPRTDWRRGLVRLYGVSQGSFLSPHRRNLRIHKLDRGAPNQRRSRLSPFALFFDLPMRIQTRPGSINA